MKRLLPQLTAAALMLERGVIVEEGTHEALWARDGVYRRLAAAQEREAAKAGE